MRHAHSNFGSRIGMQNLGLHLCVQVICSSTFELIESLETNLLESDEIIKTRHPEIVRILIEG